MRKGFDMRTSLAMALLPALLWMAPPVHAAEDYVVLKPPSGVTHLPVRDEKDARTRMELERLEGPLRVLKRTKSEVLVLTNWGEVWISTFYVARNLKAEQAPDPTAPRSRSGNGGRGFGGD